MKVWKFPIGFRPGELQKIVVPFGAEAIHWGVNPGGPMTFAVWCMVDENEPRRTEHEIMVLGTGWDLPPGLRHRATVPIGREIWHIFIKPSLNPFGGGY